MGVFQQRPSQGWGTTAELEDPVYATTKFFAALVRVPGYARMPVDQAAQDVQHSADGYAYEQWVGVATLLAGYFTGTSPAGVSCWYTPAGKPDLAGALRQLTQTFGPEGRDDVLVRITTDRSGKRKRTEAWRSCTRSGTEPGRWPAAGGVRPAVRDQSGPVCRLCVECGAWQHRLAAGQRARGPGAQQYCRGLGWWH